MRTCVRHAGRDLKNAAILPRRKACLCPDIRLGDGCTIRRSSPTFDSTVPTPSQYPTASNTQSSTVKHGQVPSIKLPFPLSKYQVRLCSYAAARKSNLYALTVRLSVQQDACPLPSTGFSPRRPCRRPVQSVQLQRCTRCADQVQEISG